MPRGGSGTGLALGSALLVAAALAVGASSASAEKTTLQALLPKSHGYRTIFTASDSRRFGASFQAFKRIHRGGLGTSYIDVHGRSLDADGRVRASLGRRGEVAGRFVESSRRTAVRARPDECVHLDIAEGKLVGRIVFRGERGFATVRTRRVPAQLTTERRIDCDDAGIDPTPRRGKEIELDACNREEELVYAARRDLAGGSALHFVESITKAGPGLIAFRQAYRKDDPETFTASLASGTARVQPGEPFSGTGFYAGGALSGNLAVRLPGFREPVPLAPAKAALGGDGDLRCPLYVAGAKRALPRGVVQRLR